MAHTQHRHDSLAYLDDAEKTTLGIMKTFADIIDDLKLGILSSERGDSNSSAMKELGSEIEEERERDPVAKIQAIAKGLSKIQMTLHAVLNAIPALESTQIESSNAISLEPRPQVRQ